MPLRRRWWFSLLFLGPAWLAHAKEQAAPIIEAIPGELRSTAQGDRIALEAGRSLLWPPSGPLTLQGPDGAVLAQVAIDARAKQQSGAEALGLNVEETDLGGAMAGQKKYLRGKRAPTGRSLEAGALAAGQNPAEAGQSQSFNAQGVPITIVSYPNGGSLWKIQWPGFTEELFFDKKKSLISDKQTRRQADTDLVLQQFADGSFLRDYQKRSGAFRVTYDANDRSYRLSFANAQGETVSEWSCEASCTQE